MTEVDAVVVGAGATGLSAARTLRDSGISVQILESKDRIGGRAYTDRDTFAVPFDHGCAWMSEGPYNPLVQFADEYGFECTARFYPLLEDKTFIGNAGSGWLTAEEASERDCYLEDSYQAIAAAGRQNRDVPITDIIDTKSVWIHHLGNYLSAVQGGDTHQISTLDFANSQAFGD